MWRRVVVAAFVAVLLSTAAFAVLDGADDDSVPAVREAVVGTDPFAADSDGDGLDDGRELALGTDPTASGPDYDGDGLGAADERALGTDPYTADSDGDGLDDGRELEIGTDPLSADTDGDGLSDRAEVRGYTKERGPLPNADPLQMDLYVRVVGPEDALSRGVEDELNREWDRMDVSNPDGSTGIDIHIIEAEAESVPERYRGTEQFRHIQAHNRRHPHPEPYHTVYLVDFSENVTVDAHGAVGGQLSVVRRGLSPGDTARVVTHELLHNVVGHVSSGSNCGGVSHACTGTGYLSPSPGTGLSTPIAEHLEAEGFVAANATNETAGPTRADN